MVILSWNTMSCRCEPRWFLHILTLNTALPLISQGRQQDGATCHGAKKTMAFPREIFAWRFLSCFSDIDLPSKSPSLSAADGFFFFFVKKFYRSKPRSVHVLNRTFDKQILISLAVLVRVMKTLMLERLPWPIRVHPQCWSNLCIIIVKYLLVVIIVCQFIYLNVPIT